MLVEDDLQIAGRVRDGLASLGFTVECCADGDDALLFGRQERFDAIILDLGLPGLPGLEVLRQWRRGGIATPVLILTARSGWVEKVDGLNAGADDYIGKPFFVPEIAARLQALMRRATGHAGAEHLRHDDIEVDPASGIATIDGTAISLTAQEFRMLVFFMHRIGRIVPQSELIDHLYSLGDERSSNTIEVYIGRLRRKIGRDAIVTLRGLGYRFG